MKNNRLVYLLFFALLSLLPVHTVAQESEANLVGFIATSAPINVRNRASANGTVISSIPPNISVPILAESEDGSWLQVTLPDGRQGWVSASLVRVMESVIPADLVEITPENAERLELITQIVPNISGQPIFSPDSRLLASHFWESHIEIYDVRTKILITSLTQHTSNITRVAFSPDGSEMASSSWDGTVKIWDVQTWGVKREFNGHATGASSVVYSPDGSMLATGGNDGLLIIWNQQTGERLHEIRAHTQPITSIEFSPDGTKLATLINRDNVLRLWDVATGENLWSKSGIEHFTFSPDGETILSVSPDRAISGISIETSLQTFSVITINGGGTAISVNPSGTLVTVGRWRSGIFDIIDIENKRTVFTDDSQRRIRQVTISSSFSPDGRLIATASDEAVFLWGVRGDE